MKSLDVMTIQAVSRVIDVQYQSHVIGSQQRLTGFFTRAGVFLTPEWQSHFARDSAAVFQLMCQINGTDECDKVLLRLAAPVEYGGDRLLHRHIVEQLSNILRAEDLEIAFSGSTPSLRAIELPEPEDPTTERTAESAAIQQVGKGVFVAHGRDTGAKDTVVRFLNGLQLDPIVLQELPGRGRTITEKFEDHASEAGFAIVLFTPDDMGSLAREGSGPEPRARQNVIFELGFFVGKLGRNKVSVLYKGEVKLPSDYVGVEYIPFDDAEGWKLKLIGELQSAGFEEVDANQVTRR